MFCHDAFRSCAARGVKRPPRRVGEGDGRHYKVAPPRPPGCKFQWQ
ncbi:hypothetical protein ACS15_2583 [Ralstonia insidiosa]|uniref:Uncharacterized protein n=1 Tax=Ralstonia insidiosa TaxID=190721 RepID=A0AAC9BE25_9RALS|nr:hypothetical protein ACS15_2583 [Ralstonia insidiosa]